MSGFTAPPQPASTLTLSTLTDPLTISYLDIRPFLNQLQSRSNPQAQPLIDILEKIQQAFDQIQTVLRTATPTLVYLAIDGADIANLAVGAGVPLVINGVQVVTIRQTGWSGPYVGTLTRIGFDTATITLQELAERVAALLTDLGPTGHGLIGP